MKLTIQSKRKRKKKTQVSETPRSFCKYNDETSFATVVDSGKQCKKAFVLYVAEAHYEDCTQNILSFVYLLIHLFKFETDEVRTFCVFVALKNFKVCILQRNIC